VLKWLLMFAALYVLGAEASCGVLMLSELVTGVPSRALVEKVHDGMTPSDVQAIMGRPSEFQLQYTCVPDCGPFSHNWTVRDHRVEVIFDRSGHVTERFVHRSTPGPIERILGRVFFWWLAAD
jgi:hypothetical protein